MTADKPGRVFDADNHLYETEDALLRYLPAKHKQAVQFVQVHGKTRIALQGKIIEYIPNVGFPVVAGPGKHVDFYSGNNADGRSLREMTGDLVVPSSSMRMPGPRLGIMDEQGIDRALMYPTLVHLVEPRLQGPDLIADVTHAVNQWIAEEWTYNYQDRIFPTPLITMGLVDRAIEELEWVLTRGAKAILVRPAPTEGYHGVRSFSLPEYDPFWARVQEADIPVVLHATDSIVAPYVNLWEPRLRDSAFHSTPFRNVVLGHRDIEDACTALICHGTLTRFPRLKIASVENGSEWVAYLFERLGMAYRQMPHQFPPEHPHDVFRRNIWVSPFWEEDVLHLLEHLPAERIVFGSDWPHPEGLEKPLDYLNNLAGLPQPTIERIMYENASELVGV